MVNLINKIKNSCVLFINKNLNNKKLLIWPLKLYLIMALKIYAPFGQNRGM